MKAADVILTLRQQRSPAAERETTRDGDAWGRAVPTSLSSQAIHRSPRMVAQRQHLRDLVGNAAQLPSSEMPHSLKSNMELLSGMSLA